jgi:hypothetical protein
VAQPLAPGKKYCPLHDVTYGALEQCSTCRSDRSGAVASESPKADTLPARIKAAEYRTYQLSCWSEYSANVKDDPHVAVKFSAEAGKWAGRADEIELRILEIEHHQWMLEQDKQRRGGGS